LTGIRERGRPETDKKNQSLNLNVAVRKNKQKNKIGKDVENPISNATKF
jgi:hypothetical protein